MKRQFEENHTRFLNLDDDRLLEGISAGCRFACSGRRHGGLVRLDRIQP